MIVVGVDAGGTKTAAAVWDADRHVAAHAGPPGAVRPGRALAASATIADVARQALATAGRSRADVLVVGAAGVGRAAERDELLRSLRAEALAGRVVVVTDVELVLAAAFGMGPGIALAAGTGSIAVRRQPDGTARRCGGYGWQMGDEGSGYALARAALEAVGKARDGRGPATLLTGALPRAARVADFDALVGWAASAAPSQVASLAPAVLEAAGSDPVAAQIAAHAAGELASLVRALLADGDLGVPLAMAGSLLAVPHHRARVEAALGDDARLLCRAGVVQPLEGARALAG